MKVLCKEYDGRVNMYQWVWKATDRDGIEFKQSTNRYICINGFNIEP
jgi:hypothetical protein